MIVLSWRDGRACTVFQLVRDGRVFVGKSYDFLIGNGFFIVNKRGVSKTAMPSLGGNTGVGQPAQWTSGYGSVTIVQFGREMAIGGMNEAGLVIETTGLFQNSRFPEPDSRPSIFMRQWLQYQIDNFSTVREVLESDAHLRIRPIIGSHAHFMASDKHGNCATIEFIDGKPVFHTNENLPDRVLTNTCYDETQKLKEADKIPVPDRFKSVERFILAAKMLKGYNLETPTPPLGYSFEILKNVEWNLVAEGYAIHSHWNIVYDQNNLRINFKTRENQKIREIDLKSLDFSCRTPVMVLDINEDLSGNVSDKFVEYSRSKNRNIVFNSFSKIIFLYKLTSEEFNALVDYPDTTTCTEQ